MPPLRLAKIRLEHAPNGRNTVTSKILAKAFFQCSIEDNGFDGLIKKGETTDTMRVSRGPLATSVRKRAARWARSRSLFTKAGVYPFYELAGRELAGLRQQFCQGVGASDQLASDKNLRH